MKIHAKEGGGIGGVDNRRRSWGILGTICSTDDLRLGGDLSFRPLRSRKTSLRLLNIFFSRLRVCEVLRIGGSDRD